MTILFADLCLLFDRISVIPPAKVGGTSSDNTPIDILALWLSHLDSPSANQGRLLFQLVFPEQDTKRRYGLKETLLGREIQKALGFRDARLDEWDGDGIIDAVERKGIDGRVSGCFGDRVEKALRFRREHKLLDSPSISIESLSSLLDELASLCSFSHSSVHSHHRRHPPRSRATILSDLISSNTRKSRRRIVGTIWARLTSCNGAIVDMAEFINGF